MDSLPILGHLSAFHGNPRQNEHTSNIFGGKATSGFGEVCCGRGSCVITLVSLTSASASRNTVPWNDVRLSWEEYAGAPPSNSGQTCIIMRFSKPISSRRTWSLREKRWQAVVILHVQWLVDSLINLRHRNSVLTSFTVVWLVIPEKLCFSPWLWIERGYTLNICVWNGPWAKIWMGCRANFQERLFSLTILKRSTKQMKFVVKIRESKSWLYPHLDPGPWMVWTVQQCCEQ